MKAPLAGLRVLDFGHTVMGPCCGLVLADLGAEVIRIEPADGDPTRRLKGFGTGYFGFFNRNKGSLAIDLKSAQGQAIVHRLLEHTDVVIENFSPGAMQRLALDYATASAINPRLVYASLKGFLKGPYENRLALDEVVQMMSGLAFMTGPTGRPLRAGASVIDICGGLFAGIGILTALRERERTGKGQLVESALFETAVFMMGQHLSYAAQSNAPVQPMPERVSAWAIYDLFDVIDGRQLFVGITSDAHWCRFCEVFAQATLANDAGLATNNQRIAERPRLMPLLRKLFASMPLAEAITRCEKARIPFAAVGRPEDLLRDPHLAQTDGLLPTRLPGGIEALLPRLPITLENQSFDLRRNPPSIGEDTFAILRDAGYDDTTLAKLLADGVVSAAPSSATGHASS